MKYKIILAIIVLGSGFMTYVKDVTTPGRLKHVPTPTYAVFYMPAGTVITCPDDNSPVLFTPTGIDGILDPLKFIPLKRRHILSSGAKVPCDSVKEKCYHTANGWRGGSHCFNMKSPFYRAKRYERAVNCRNTEDQGLDVPEVQCEIVDGFGG